MGKNLIKAISLILITAFSLQISAFFINDYVIEVQAKEKSIADMIIKRQMQEALKEAEAKIEAAKKEENIVIETEEVEMKPPVEPTKPPKEETIVANEDVNTEAGTEDNTPEKPVEEANTIIIPGLGEIEELNEETVVEIGRYLVDNYFLNGYEYAENETDPARKAKKELARDMEAYVVDSLQIMIEILDIFQTLEFEGINDIRQRISDLGVEFNDKYSTVDEFGPEFVEISTFINQYFEKSLFALDKANEIFNIMNTSSNKVLALTIALASIEKDIMPALKDVLNSGFELKEKTNVIYLDGVDNKALLTKQDVMEILKVLEKAIFK